MNATRFLSGIVSNKLAALLGGTTGFADIQNWYNLVNITTTICGSAYQNLLVGTIKAKLPRNLLLIPFFILPIITIISLFLFKNMTSVDMILISTSLIISGLFSIINTIWIAQQISNGQQLRYMLTNIIHAIIYLILLGAVFIFQNTVLLLIIFSLSQFIFTLAILITDPNSFLVLKILSKERNEHAAPIQYIFFVGLPAIIGLFTIFGLRQYIEYETSNDEANLWTSVKKIGEIHLSFYLILISTYLAPKLKGVCVKKLLGIIALFCGMFFGTSFLLNIFKELIIIILYNREFLYITDYLLIQCISDVLTLTNIILGTCLLVNEKKRTYFVVEMLSLIILSITFFALLDHRLGSSIMTYLIANINIFCVFMFVTIKAMKNS